MLLQRLTMVDNVIKIKNNKAIKERSKYLVHEGAKLGYYVIEANGQDEELI